MESVTLVRRKFDAMAPVLDEVSRRRWAAAEARALGWGGVSLVAKATGMSRNTIDAGMRELEEGALDSCRVRRAAEAESLWSSMIRGSLLSLSPWWN